MGKGTYARRIAPIHGLGHVSPGDLLRAAVASRPDINDFLRQGKLVPESIVFSLVEERISVLRNQAGLRGVVLDGFPRSREQAVGWFGSCSTRKPDLVVELFLPEEILVQKILGRRTCSCCGDLYNVFSFTEGEYRMPAMMPQKEGVCDKCGGSLVQRVDDTEEVIQKRLKNHSDTETELIEYIRNHICDNVIKFHVKTGIAQLDDLAGDIKQRL